MAKSVLVVDDVEIIRRALCELFTSEADFDVCGEAENGREAIEKAQDLRVFSASLRNPDTKASSNSGFKDDER